MLDVYQWPDFWVRPWQILRWWTATLAPWRKTAGPDAWLCILTYVLGIRQADTLVADLVRMLVTVVPFVLMLSFFWKKALFWQHTSQMTWLFPHFFCRQVLTFYRVMGSPLPGRWWYYHYGDSLDVGRANITTTYYLCYAGKHRNNPIQGKHNLRKMKNKDNLPALPHSPCQMWYDACLHADHSTGNPGG